MQYRGKYTDSGYVEEEEESGSPLFAAFAVLSVGGIVATMVALM